MKAYQIPPPSASERALLELGDLHEALLDRAGEQAAHRAMVAALEAARAAVGGGSAPAPRRAPARRANAAAARSSAAVAE